jgi:hypothetical protein
MTAAQQVGYASVGTSLELLTAEIDWVRALR